MAEVVLLNVLWIRFSASPWRWLPHWSSVPPVKLSSVKLLPTAVAEWLGRLWTCFSKDYCMPKACQAIIRELQYAQLSGSTWKSLWISPTPGLKSEPAGNGWNVLKWLESACKLLEINGNCCKWLELLKMAVNCCKWSEMAGNCWKS